MDRIIVVLLLGTASFLNPAHAAPEVRVSVGLNTSTADAAPLPPLTQTNLSDEFGGTGPRTSFGVSWSDHLSFEFGWSRFGSASGVVIRPYIPPPGTPAPVPWPDPTMVPAKQSGSAFWVAYTPSWRYGPLELSPKVGVARTRRTSEVSDNTPNRYTDQDTEIIFGGTAAHWFNDRFALQLDFERLGGTATQLGLSASIRF